MRDDLEICSICLNPVGDSSIRSTANLSCGHVFHLVCIGSAFNAIRMMRCPICRNEEEGEWLYASGLNDNHSFSDDFDGIAELDAVPDIDPLQASPTFENMMSQVNRDPGSSWQLPESESGVRRRTRWGPATGY